MIKLNKTNDQEIKALAKQIKKNCIKFLSNIEKMKKEGKYLCFSGC